MSSVSDVLVGLQNRGMIDKTLLFDIELLRIKA